MGPYLFVANDRALDFVNTAFAGGDTVPDFDAYVGWLAAAGMMTSDEAETVLARATDAARVRIVARLRTLRAALRRTVEAFVEGRVPAENDLTVVNAYLAHVPVHDELVVAADGVASVRRTATDTPDALLYFPAEAARDLLTRKNARAIRRCANEACTHYFYDASKNGTRRWCSMAACGNREKVSALRTRRRVG